MRFSIRARFLPKIGATDADIDDFASWHLDPDGTVRAALGDGASNSYDAGRWAHLVVDAFVRGAIDTDRARPRQLGAIASAARILEATRDTSALADTPTWLINTLERRGAHTTL